MNNSFAKSSAAYTKKAQTNVQFGHAGICCFVIMKFNTETVVNIQNKDDFLCAFRQVVGNNNMVVNKRCIKNTRYGRDYLIWNNNNVLNVDISQNCE